MARLIGIHECWLILGDDRARWGQNLFFQLFCNISAPRESLIGPEEKHSYELFETDLVGVVLDLFFRMILETNSFQKQIHTTPPPSHLAGPGRTWLDLTGPDQT